jgi:putative MATE family efflux protein
MVGATAEATPAAIPTSVLRLAWPVMVSNLLATLTTTIDIIMVGSLAGVATAAVSAVGLGGQILFLFFGIMISVSAGAVALVARAIGARNQAEADEVLKQSLALGALLAVPLTVVGVAFARPLLLLFDPEPEVVELGTPYIQVVSLSVVFQFLVFLSSFALRGAGDTVTPLWIGVIVNVVNAFANYNLIFGNALIPPLGVVGAGAGTSIAFGVGAVTSLAIFVRGRGRLRLTLRGPWIRRSLIARIFRIGWPSALEQMLFHTALLIWVAMVVAFGNNALAAHQIGLRIQMFAFMPGFGFAIAATALVGQNLGALRPEVAERKGWEATKWAVAVMGATAAGIFVLAPWIARAFIADEDVIALTVTFIRIHALSIPAVGAFFAIDGALKGAGDTRYPLLASFTGLYAVRLPLSLLLGFWLGLGLLGVWASLVVEYWCRAGLISIRFRRGGWKALKV